MGNGARRRARVLHGLIAAAVMAGVVAAFALLRMPATRAASGAGRHLH